MYLDYIYPQLYAITLHESILISPKELLISYLPFTLNHNTLSAIWVDSVSMGMRSMVNLCGATLLKESDSPA